MSPPLVKHKNMHVSMYFLHLVSMPPLLHNGEGSIVGILVNKRIVYLCNRLVHNPIKGFSDPDHQHTDLLPLILMQCYHDMEFCLVVKGQRLTTDTQLS